MADNEASYQRLSYGMGYCKLRDGTDKQSTAEGTGN